MRKIREVLRLYFAAALSIRAIARSLGTSPSTVGDYLRRGRCQPGQQREGEQEVESGARTPQTAFRLR